MRWCIGLVALLIATAPGFAQVRVVNYNIAKLAGSPSAMTAVIAAAHADDTPGFSHPVDIFMFQEVPNASLAGISAIIANAAPAGSTYALATYTTSSSEDSATGAQACFYRTQTIIEVASGHVDIATGASRNSDRWQLKLVGYSSAAASFYTYSSHLKASPGYESERLAGAQALRNNGDSLGAGARCIFVGDYNIYTNTEPAYGEMVSTGNSQGVDPLGTGNWTGATNAWKHTQSPRLASGTLVGGGMDDRFDFQLPSTALSDGTGISIIPGSLRPLGNDGNHYDIAINTGSNTFYPGQAVRSNALAAALFDASDHVPLMVDYQVPGVLAATLGAVPPRVILGAAVNASVAVSNTVVVAAPICADDLAFSATGSGAVSGASSGTAPLAPATTSALLPLSTSSVGAKTGLAWVTSTTEAVQNPSLSIPVSYSVLAHANGSFSNTADQNTRTVVWSIAQGTPQSVYDLSVYNFGAGALQALLDLDSDQLVSGRSVQVQSGLAQGIGSTPANLRFVLASGAMQPGTYTSIVQLNASDENIPGASTQALTVQFNITVTGAGVPGDLDGDGTVNGADLALLLGNWGQAGTGDIDGDGTVTGVDLGSLLGAWS